MADLRTFIVTAALVAAASGCMQPSVSATAAPGAAPASPATAGQLFAKGCLQQLPSFAGTPAAIANDPITRRQSSGTYYHNTQNLSLKLLPGYCSVVFGTTGNTDDVINAFGTAASAAAPGVQADITLDFTPGPEGLTYYNARVRAQ